MPYAYDNNGHNMQLIVEVIITSHTGSSGLMSVQGVQRCAKWELHFQFTCFEGPPF